jgi:hypothetical protein
MFWFLLLLNKSLLYEMGIGKKEDNKKNTRKRHVMHLKSTSITVVGF